MTHGFSSSDKSKKPMNCYYDFSTGKFYAYDSNEELQEITIGGGGNMRCAKYGKITSLSSGTATVSIASLGLTSADQYMIILDGETKYGNNNTGALAITEKTATSFTVASGVALTDCNVSYQIIVFE